MEVEYSSPSLEQLKKSEYKRCGEVYRPLITGEKYEHKLTYNEKTADVLDDLPASDKQRVKDFTSRVSSFIPETIFDPNRNAPTSRVGLRALIAHAYRVDEAAHQDGNTREMYIRALSALSGDTLYFMNGSNVSTEDAIDDYFERDYSIDSFANLLAHACTASMPVAAGSEKFRSIYKTDFDVFFDKQRQRYQKAMSVLLDYVGQHFPDKVAKIAEWTNNLVFVESISRLKLYTNDEQLSTEANYSSLSAGAVAFGVDHISGLPMTVTHRPYNYDQVAKNPSIEPNQDPTYKETLTLIHENIHNVQPERDFSGDYMHLVNELLTDATSWIITLKSEDQDFVNCGDEYIAYTGYFDLVLLARNLVKNDLLSNDEMVNLGLHQDPKGFLSLLADRVRQCQDASKVKDVVRFLEMRMLIKPRKMTEQADLITKFRSDPTAFLENECMEMWGMVGPQYLGQKFYLLAILDLFRERHPDVGEQDYGSIRNPDGTLLDEAVDIFHNVIKPDKRYRRMFLKTEKMDELLSQNEPWLTYNDLDIPEALRVGPDEIGIIRELIDNTSVILNAGLDYHVGSWNDNQRFNAIISASRELYKRSIGILERNWRSNGITYGKEDLLKILGDLAPQWLPWQHQVAEPREVIDKVLEGIDAMTHPIETPEGQQIFGPEQLLYWGPALELNRT